MSQLQHGAVISAREAAELLREDLRTVQRKARTGEYPSLKLPGRTGAYLFERAVVEGLVAARHDEARAAS